LQVAPLATGQTLNLGESMNSAGAMWALTEIPVLFALVLHTQMTKLAVCPALTSDEVEKDCTRTQSCGVFLPGAGEVGVPLGVGVGVGVGALELGSGLGLGVVLAGLWVADELGVGDELVAELPDGEGEDVSEAEVLGLEGSLLADVLPEDDALDDAALLLVTDLLGDDEVLADDLALLVADVLAVADALRLADPLVVAL